MLKRFRRLWYVALAGLLMLSSFSTVFASNAQRGNGGNDRFSDRNIPIPEYNDITLHKLEYRFDRLDRSEDMLRPEPHPEVDDNKKTEGGEQTPVYDSRDTVAGIRDSRLGELDSVEKPGIQNTGDEIDTSELSSRYTTKAYSPSLYGEVEFSLFKLDRSNETIRDLLPDVDYVLDANDTQRKEHSQSQMRAVREVGEALEQAFLNGSTLPYGAELVETKEVDENGRVTFERVKTYDLVNGQRQTNHYIFVETKHPDMVVGKSNPLFVSLPVTNVNGTHEELQTTPYKEHIHLYPKNEVKEQTFVFNKFRSDFGGVEGIDANIEQGRNQLTNLENHDGALQGAKFHIYEGLPRDYQNNQPLGNQSGPFVVETDENGQVDITGLTRGTYYLVEIETENLVDGMLVEAERYEPREGFRYLAGFDSLNNPYNILTFNVGRDGVVRYGSELDEGRLLNKTNILEYINHFVPEMDKELTAYVENGGDRTLENGWDYFENIPFRVTLTVPNNIWQYSKFEFKDQLEVSNEERTSETVTPTEHAEFVRGGDGRILFNVVTDKGETLERDVDYWVVSSNEDGLNNQFEISFADPSRNTLTAEDTTPQNNRFSNKVINAREIYVSYHAQLNAQADPDVLYSNRAEFTYNNAPEAGLTEDRFDRDKEEFKTFGHRFVKEDAGLFSTSVGRQTLSGAEFIVRNSEGQYFNGYTHTQNQAGDAGNGTLEPVWVDFENDQVAFNELRRAENPGREDAILTSDEQGLFEIRGLKEGTYTLIEVNAPEGYRLPENPETEFEVGENVWTETTSIRTDIQNERSPEMPLTGSERTTIILGVGALVVAMAGAAYAVYNKNSKKELI